MIFSPMLVPIRHPCTKTQTKAGTKLYMATGLHLGQHAKAHSSMQINNLWNSFKSGCMLFSVFGVLSWLVCVSQPPTLSIYLKFCSRHAAHWSRSKAFTL